MPMHSRETAVATTTALVLANDCSGKTISDAGPRAANVNWDQQMRDWKAQRLAKKQNPCQWSGADGFRQHEIDITPQKYDPGETPTESFCQNCPGAVPDNCKSLRTGSAQIDQYICFIAQNPIVAVGGIALAYLIFRANK